MGVAPACIGAHGTAVAPPCGTPKGIKGKKANMKLSRAACSPFLVVLVVMFRFVSPLSSSCYVVCAGKVASLVSFRSLLFGLLVDGGCAVVIPFSLACLSLALARLGYRHSFLVPAYLLPIMTWSHRAPGEVCARNGRRKTENDKPPQKHGSPCLHDPSYHHQPRHPAPTPKQREQ
jgi:hypothetical protein